MEFHFFKLEIFLPESAFDAVRNALFAVDAGHIGNYDHCYSVSEVTSCWRPLHGTNPWKGTEGKLATERELKLEICCLADRLDETMAAVKSVHPYEEPVINVIPLYRTGI